MPYNFKPPKHIHFSGICGTAMAPLSVLMQTRGFIISGSDEHIYPPMSNLLRQHQIDVFQGYSQENLIPRPDLVVIGNALSRGNPEVEAVLSQGLHYTSVAEMLKDFFIRGKNSLVVTGTHGKTTATSLLSWVFESAGLEPGFLIGGIAENFGTSCREGKGLYFITEGDEYDTAFFDKRSKFFHYLPNQLLINNLEYDHADIFDSLQDIRNAFCFLLRLVPENGIVVANGDDPQVAKVLSTTHSPVITFGFGKHNRVRSLTPDIHSSGTEFNVRWLDSETEDSFHIPLYGRHNVMNALGVIALASHNGIDIEIIKKALSSFSSVRRRLELRGEKRNVLVYDDFAHHPTAVKVTIRAVRQLHPDRRVIAVFEPRSNTCVLKVHQKPLVYALCQADRVLIARPHRHDRIPADRLQDVWETAEAVSSQGVPAQALPHASSIIDRLSSECESGDVVLIMSNGGFDNIHQRLLSALET